MMNPLTANTLSPLLIGANLILTQSGLSQVSTFSFPNLASDTLVSQTATQTLSNKTIDAIGTNQVAGIHQASVIRRFGDFNPQPNLTSGGNQGLMGCLAANTHVGASFSNAWDATYGLYQRYTTAATSNSQGGIISPTTGVGVAQTNFPGRYVTRVRLSSTSNVRFYSGFTSNTILPTTDTPLATTDSGLLIGYRSTDADWMIFYNNGGGSALTAISLGVAKDTNFHLLIITWPQAGAQINFSIDLRTPITISSGLPSTGVGMFINNVAQTTTTSAINYDMKGPFYELQDCSAFI